MTVEAPNADIQDALRIEEFRALRATIRERGTLRVRLASAGLLGWAVTHLAVLMWLPTPVTLLVPLLVLTGVFEAVFALHVGVERIGRYIEAVYEADSSAGAQWEHTAHAFGRAMTESAGKLDPLFSMTYCGAALLNLVPLVLRVAAVSQWTSGETSELAVYGGLHVAFVVRVLRARAFAARQRRLELEQFERLAARD